MSSHGGEIRRVAGILFMIFALVPLTMTLARAEDDASFYRGKLITFIVGSGAGGVYDVSARVLAPFLTAHIPGNPKIVIENMPGASGLKSASYMASAAPRDGTVIALPLASVGTAQLLTPSGANFDPTKFSWVGSITRDPYIGYVWHTSPIQTLDDLKTKEVVMGADSLGSAGADVAVIAKAFLGLKIKLVLGYTDSPAVKLAMEKGEVEGTFANALADLKTQRPEWIRDGTVRIIVQHGFERSPELPNVPLLIDLARTDADRQALKLLLARQEFAKPIFAPPGIPAARLAILRRAFDESMQDPAFLKASRDARLSVDSPMSGADLAKAINDLGATPHDVVQRMLDAFANYK
ncbi:MAG TPA: tripartite tricarboxylate transporter substrate-binding protein [Beijerinckiaceae bacterium]|nr:tripartite tricarboxylate transporter substrate-binding protein [Beijerinckiaceae bacterium]